MVTLPLDEWYSFTIRLPKGNPYGQEQLEVVPKKRYDEMEAQLSEKNQPGTRWMSRNLKVGSASLLFVRCAKGGITSGYYTGETWFVYDFVKGEYFPEKPENPVTHYCSQPLIQPWSF